jgi:hypothetical protein
MMATAIAPTGHLLISLVTGSLWGVRPGVWWSWDAAAMTSTLILMFSTSVYFAAID